MLPAVVILFPKISHPDTNLEDMKARSTSVMRAVGPADVFICVVLESTDYGLSGCRCGAHDHMLRRCPQKPAILPFIPEVITIQTHFDTSKPPSVSVRMEPE